MPDEDTTTPPATAPIGGQAGDDAATGATGTPGAAPADTNAPTGDVGAQTWNTPTTPPATPDGGAEEVMPKADDTTAAPAGDDTTTTPPVTPGV